MNVSLRDGRSAEIRLLQQHDGESLYNYLQQLSPESRSRFGPHSFDWRAVHSIFDQPDATIHRYVAIDETDHSIIAYMLVKQGMIEADQKRYGVRGQFFNQETTVQFAPSVADTWQSAGLGTAMSTFIEEDLITKNTRHIILWGGVQASNEKSVNFYKKLGYRFVASFMHDGKDNHDMIKEL